VAPLSLIKTALVVSAVSVGLPLSAQTAVPRTPEQLRASTEAHADDFDYLLGDWEFTAQSRQYGAMRGYWSAVRLTEGAQVLDE